MVIRWSRHFALFFTAYTVQCIPSVYGVRRTRYTRYIDYTIYTVHGTYTRTCITHCNIVSTSTQLSMVYMVNHRDESACVKQAYWRALCIVQCTYQSPVLGCNLIMCCTLIYDLKFLFIFCNFSELYRSLYYSYALDYITIHVYVGTGVITVS